MPEPAMTKNPARARGAGHHGVTGEAHGDEAERRREGSSLAQTRQLQFDGMPQPKDEINGCAYQGIRANASRSCPHCLRTIPKSTALCPICGPVYRHACCDSLKTPLR